MKFLVGIILMNSPQEGLRGRLRVIVMKISLQEEVSLILFVEKNVDIEDRPIGGKSKNVDFEDRPISGKSKNIDFEDRPIGGKKSNNDFEEKPIAPKKKITKPAPPSVAISAYDEKPIGGGK